jgi:hypothetical protein
MMSLGSTHMQAEHYPTHYPVQYHIPYALCVDESSSHIPPQVVMSSGQLAEASTCSCTSVGRACCSCDGMAIWRCLNCMDSEHGAACSNCIGSAGGALCACGPALFGQ